jgi:hypothetical protein
MRNRTLCSLAVTLAIAALSAGCSKKPAPAASVEDPHPDGVSGVPAPAEREADLPAADLPIAGAVKEVKFKVLDKDADDKTKGLLRLKAFGLDGPVDIAEQTRWEVWKQGADPEEQKPEMTAWSSSEQAVPAGTWDIRLLYEEGAVKAQGWVKNVKIDAGKLWKGEAVMATPMQYVRLYATLNGTDVADNCHIDVFKAGTDEEEFPPLVSFWTTQKNPLPEGSYDLRLIYDRNNVKAKGSFKGIAVGSNHGILKKTFALTK